MAREESPRVAAWQRDAEGAVSNGDFSEDFYALCHMTPPVTLTLQQSYKTRMSLVPVMIRFPLFMTKRKNKLVRKMSELYVNIEF